MNLTSSDWHLNTLELERDMERGYWGDMTFDEVMDAITYNKYLDECAYDHP
jgi:hypothetical protein